VPWNVGHAFHVTFPRPPSSAGVNSDGRMPIYDISYKRLQRRPRLPRFPWFVIARQGISARLSRRSIDFLLMGAAIPLLYYCVCLFLEFRFPDLVAQVPRLRVTLLSFTDLMRAEMLFAFLMTIFSGSALISGDLRTRALPLYLSKPITRVDYILGKLLVPAVLLALVTLLPSLILLFLRVTTSKSLDFITANPLVLFRILAASGASIATMSLLITALSALSRSSWLPGLGFAIIYIFGRALGSILHLFTGSDLPMLLSLRDDIREVAAAAFGHYLYSGIHSLLAVLALLCFGFASLLILAVRVRAVEVVSS